MTALASVVSGDTAVYRPTDDEPFMNERQVAYFKTKLLSWKDDILRESKGTVTNLKAETENHPDLVDRASSESDRALELRTRDRQRKLISKIDDALRQGIPMYFVAEAQAQRPPGGSPDGDLVGRGSGAA